MIDGREHRRDSRPPQAWWDPDESEWVFGDRDAQGRLTGPVRYWDARGRFISECVHEAGRPHGVARRYHPDSGELDQDCRYVDGRLHGPLRVHRPRDVATGAAPDRIDWSTVDDRVVGYDCGYDSGDLLGTHFRDAAGVEVDQQGNPIPARPAGVAPTAARVGDRWVFVRKRDENIVEIRQWHTDGRLMHEREPDGTHTEYHPTGAVAERGRQVPRDGRRPLDGVWRYHDRSGVRYRESTFDPSVGYGVETARTWYRADGARRTGPVRDGQEVGEWVVHDPTGQAPRAVRLGQAYTDKQLLATAAATTEAAAVQELRALLDEATATDPDGLPEILARIRLAGRTGDGAALRELSDPGGRWPRPQRADWRWDPGGPQPERDWPPPSLTGLLIDVRWGEPAGPALADAAHLLMQADLPAAALDVLDAAAIAEPPPPDRDLHRTRCSLLRLLGRTAEEPMPEGDELLAAIRDRPDDDVPRLRYADLVQDTEPAHSALIRIQCGQEFGDEAAAVVAYRATLPPEVRDLLAEQPERGFHPPPAGGTWIDAQTFLRRHEALRRARPGAAEVRLMFASQHIAELAVCPGLSHQRGLSLVDTYLFEGRATQLSRSPYLSGLEHLGLTDTNLYDEDLTPVLTSTAYPRLASLEIGTRRDDQEWTLDGLAPIARAVFAPHLRRLSLSRRYLGPDVIALLATLPQLTELDLEANDIGDAGALALAGSATLAGLRMLEMGGAQLSETATQALRQRFGDRVQLTHPWHRR